MYDDSDYDYGIPERKPTSPRDERAGTFFGDLKRAMKQVHRTGAFAACGHDSGLPAPRLRVDGLDAPLAVPVATLESCVLKTSTFKSSEVLSVFSWRARARARAPAFYKIRLYRICTGRERQRAEPEAPAPAHHHNFPGSRKSWILGVRSRFCENHDPSM